MNWAHRYVLTLLSLAVVVTAYAGPEEQETLVHEDFSTGMNRWWTEGGQRIWVDDGSLHMQADPAKGDEGRAATAWLRQELPADIRVTLDAQVISSKQGINNINVFLNFSDPDGSALYETRESRADASYSLYHELNGYIITFLVDRSDETLDLPADERPARVRIRRCPGFELMAESYAYHNRIGRTYRVEILKRGGQLVFSVDGKELLRAHDDKPHEGGLLGLRTFGTYLRWSDIEVSRVRSARPAVD